MGEGSGVGKRMRAPWWHSDTCHRTHISSHRWSSILTPAELISQGLSSTLTPASHRWSSILTPATELISQGLPSILTPATDGQAHKHTAPNSYLKDGRAA
eukprot:967288-Pyramimonas_sp.AAC.1